MQYTPLLIIGAPRSGTNMLRDVLTELPGVNTWPCDEINYIWRHGNVRYASDEFSLDMARPEVSGYIRKQFDWVSGKYQAHTVVEKTCANSLRVGFVNKVLPEAKYIFIRRDGVDAVGSAIKRWKAELDIPYLARKARFVPFSDLFYYGSRFFWNRTFRLFSSEDRLAFWGPKLDNMDGILKNHSLPEVCALQWKRCVDNSADVFASLPNEQWKEVGYETFVTSPVVEFKKILDFLELQVPDDRVEKMVSEVSPYSIGKGRKGLGDESVAKLMPLIQDTLARYGYV